MSTTLSLSQRLKTETADDHERMHRLMADAAPFASRERYARFVAAQYLFQRDIEHLFAAPAVQAAVPDLSVRGRTEASLADLADLGAPVPVDGIATGAVAMPEALGWIYVSEGSTLGAAFLLQEVGAKLGLNAGFGARHLAAYPEGRMRVWKRFVAALDADALQPLQQPVVDGAHAAFGRFAQLLAREFARDGND
ncbi:biliverdin-producing heme oxygenase [Xylophilus sp. Kf1]|nr:biliverdin-producing heme oxygenase [Xylophilus sp. Kf1]